MEDPRSGWCSRIFRTSPKHIAFKDEKVRDSAPHGLSQNLILRARAKINLHFCASPKHEISCPECFIPCGFPYRIILSNNTTFWVKKGRRPWGHSIFLLQPVGQEAPQALPDIRVVYSKPIQLSGNSLRSHPDLRSSNVNCAPASFLLSH